MQINMDDVRFSGEMLAREVINKLGNEEINSNLHITEEVIINSRKKYSWENILKTEHGIKIVEMLIAGSIQDYHEQLREKLLEQSIDIGEIDFTSPGVLRSSLAQNSDED